MAEHAARSDGPGRPLPFRPAAERLVATPPSAPPAAGPRAPLAPQGLTVAASFTGATHAESGFVPPDSMGAVGPTQFLVAINGRIRVFSKTGVVGALNTSLATFFSSVL